MLLARRNPARWLHAFLVLASIFSLQAAGQTAYIARDMAVSYNSANHSFSRLSTALRSSNYTTILLTADCRVSPASYPEDAPIRISKNLTISSANTTQGGPFALETEFLEQRVIIGNNVTLTLKNVALARARKSSGQGIPFFAGEGPGSLLVLQDVVRVRLACAPNTPELLAVLEDTPRPPGLLETQLQLVSIVNLMYRGQMYKDSLHAQDFASFVSPGDVADTRAYYAGYNLLQLNTSRVCLSYVSQSCIDQKGADVCVTDAVNAILAAESAAAKRSAELPIAAVVAPVVIAGALLFAGIGAAYLLLRRRKRTRTAAAVAEPAAKDLQDQGRQQVLQQQDKENHDSDPSDIIGVRGGAMGSLEALAVGNRGGGWKLLACHTSPEFKDATPNDRIKLGLLLGAGSFGRVYKGVWHNMDVAVKVLQHDSTTAAAISNEVDLVMSFRHPNIVAAYHFVTWTQTGPAEHDANDRINRHGSLQRDTMSTQGPSSAALGSVTSGQQLAVVPETYPAKLKTVAESTAGSSRSSFPKPPGVVVSSKDGSTFNSTLGSTAAMRTTSSTSGTMATSPTPSSSSNVSAVLAENSAVGNAYAAAAYAAGSPGHAAGAAQHQAHASSDSITARTVLLQRASAAESDPLATSAAHHAQQVPRRSHTATLISRLLQPHSSHGTLSRMPPSAAAAAGQMPRAGPIAEGTESGAEATAAFARPDSSALQAAEVVQSQQPPAVAVAGSAAAAAAALPVVTSHAAGSGESSWSTGPEWVVRIGPPETPAAKAQAGSTGHTNSKQTSVTPAPANVATDRDAEKLTPAVFNPAQQQGNSQSTALTAASVYPAWPVLSLPAAAAARTSSLTSFAGASAGTNTALQPADQDSMFSVPGPVGSYKPPQEPQLVRNLSQAQDSSPAAGQYPAATVAAAGAEQVGHAVQHVGAGSSNSCIHIIPIGLTPGAGLHHTGTLQFVPLTPAQAGQQQQQQQQRSVAGSNSGSYAIIPMTPAGLASTASNIQQGQQHHSQQPQQPLLQQVVVLQHDCEPGSGWKHVGEDLEMDASGNLYSTPHNVRGGGGGGAHAGSTVDTATAGSGLTAGSRSKRAGQATEAQTWLILEYCDGGTLLDLLQDGRLESTTKEGRKMALVLTLLHGVACGMNYLHSRSVIHGDLKPGNVLIKQEPGAPYGQVAKVSDFGLSRALQVGQSHRSTRTMGTMNHTPPELLRLGRLSPAGDVYAFGILMWEVFTGKVAFSGLHYGEVFEQVALWQKRPPVPAEMPQDYAALMMQCWAADPFSRPPFSHVQQQLQELLQRHVQDDRAAQEKFVSDL